MVSHSSENNVLIIQPAKPQDRSAIVAIADMELGRGYLQTQMLTQPGSLVHVARQQDRVIGFVLAEYCAIDVFKQRYAQLTERIDQTTMQAGRIGVVRTLAVMDRHQGHGVGSRLLAVGCELLQDHGVTCIVMPGWHSRHGTNIRPLADKADFHSAGTLERYWYEASLRNGFTCPVCGPPPCECGVTLFVKRINKTQ